MAVVEFIFQLASSITAACVGCLYEVTLLVFQDFAAVSVILFDYIKTAFTLGGTKVFSLTLSIIGLLYEVALLVFQDFVAVSVILFDYIKTAFILGGTIVFSLTLSIIGCLYEVALLVFQDFAAVSVILFDYIKTAFILGGTIVFSLTLSIIGCLYEVVLLVFQDFAAVSVILFDYIKTAFTLGGTIVFSLTLSIIGCLYEVALLVFQDFAAVSVILFDYIKTAFTLGGTIVFSLTLSIIGCLYEVALLVFQDFAAVSVILFDYIKTAFTLGVKALSTFSLDMDVVRKTVATFTTFLEVRLRTVYDVISFSFSYLFQAFSYMMTVALAAFEKIQATCSFIFSGVLFDTLREMLLALRVGIDDGVNMLVSVIWMALKVGGSILILAIGLLCILLALNLCFHNAVQSKRVVSSICKTFTRVLKGVISLVLGVLKLLNVVPQNRPGVDPVQDNLHVTHQQDTTPAQEPSRNRQRDPQVVPTFGPKDTPTSRLVPKTAPTTGGGKNGTNLSDDDRQCIICYDNQKTVMIKTCNHVMHSRTQWKVSLVSKRH